MPGQCSTSARAKNPAITCIVCQAVPRGPPHFSDHTTLVCCCCLLLWPLREAPALRKIRNRLYCTWDLTWRTIIQACVSRYCVILLSPPTLLLRARLQLLRLLR